MFYRFMYCRAHPRKRLTSTSALASRRFFDGLPAAPGTALRTVLLAMSCCALISACSDDDKPATLTPAAQAQVQAQQSGTPGAPADARNTPPTGLTIQTPARPAAQTASQAGAAASDSLAAPVIHTVD